MGVAVVCVCVCLCVCVYSQAPYFNEKRNDTFSCTLEDIQRHSQQHSEAVQAAKSLPARHKAIEEQAAWQYSQWWSLSQKSCLHGLNIAVQQLSLRRQQRRQLRM